MIDILIPPLGPDLPRLEGCVGDQFAGRKPKAAASSLFSS
jgi:hypothetical protein